MKLSVLLLLAFSVATTKAFVAKPHASSPTSTTTALGMGLLNRFRKRRQVQDQAKSPIAVGTVLPDVDVERFVGGSSEDGGTATAQAISIREALQTSDKALLIGMPGAL